MRVFWAAMFEVCSCFQSSKQTHRHTSAHHVCLFACQISAWRRSNLAEHLGGRCIGPLGKSRSQNKSAVGRLFLQGGKKCKSYRNHTIVHPVKTSRSTNVGEMPASLAGQIPPFVLDRNSKTQPHTPWIKKTPNTSWGWCLESIFFWGPVIHLQKVLRGFLDVRGSPTPQLLSRLCRQFTRHPWSRGRLRLRMSAQRKSWSWKSWRVRENLGTSGISVDTMKVAALKLSPTCKKWCPVEAEVVLTSSGMCSGS